MSQASSPIAALLSMGNLTFGLTGLIAVANLTPPTHRRCLILMKALLEKHASTQLQEELLQLLRVARLDRAQVEAYLQDVAEAFDSAVQVSRTPVPGAFKLYAHVRPYFIDGAQEMIDEGYPREAMLWILGCLVISNSAIQADAPEDEKIHFQAKVNCLLAEMGWSTMGDLTSRLQRAKELTNDVFKVADDRVRRHPEIMD